MLNFVKTKYIWTPYYSWDWLLDPMMVYKLAIFFFMYFIYISSSYHSTWYLEVLICWNDLKILSKCWSFFLQFFGGKYYIGTFSIEYKVELNWNSSNHKKYIINSIYVNNYAWYFDSIVCRFPICSKLHMVFSHMISIFNFFFTNQRNNK